MTWIIDTKSRRRFSAKLTAGLALSAMLALGTFTVPAYAAGNGHREYRNNWNGGYYEAPPVVYGSVYGPSYYGEPYYPPPVVYGPGVGFNIRIH
jgi:hypothetical protein